MSLHGPVLFLGDRPNPTTNLSMDVPFVGTKSYKMLLEWIYRMNLDVTEITLAYAYDVHGSPSLLGEMLIADHIGPRQKIVALGETPSRYLDQISQDYISPIKYCTLPHPSEIVDKKQLNAALVKCKNFIYKQSKV